MIAYKTVLCSHLLQRNPLELKKQTNKKTISVENQTSFCRGWVDLSETGLRFCLVFVKFFLTDKGSQILVFERDSEFDL